MERHLTERIGFGSLGRQVDNSERRNDTLERQGTAGFGESKGDDLPEIPNWASVQQLPMPTQGQSMEMDSPRGVADAWGGRTCHHAGCYSFGFCVKTEEGFARVAQIYQQQFASLEAAAASLAYVAEAVLSDEDGYISSEEWSEDGDIIDIDGQRAASPTSVAHLEGYLVRSALNGNHGEWTNGDDMGGKMKKVLNKLGKIKLRGNQKKVARALAMGALTRVVGQGTAKNLYKLGAGAAKAITSRASRTPGLDTPPVLTNRPNFSGLVPLSGVASKYVLSFTKPFDPRASGVHMPHFPATPSHCVTAYIRGTFQTGANGFGYVVMTPCAANNAPTGYVTSNAHTGQLIDVPTALNANGVFAFSHNGPYTYAQMISSSINTQIECRVVSAGLRVRYAGSELNRGGLGYAICDANNDSIIGETTNDLGQRDGCEILDLGVKRDITIVAVPARVHDYDYVPAGGASTGSTWPYWGVSTSVDPTSTPTNVASPFCGILINSAVASQLFFYEYVSHLEYHGQGVGQSNLAEHESDEIGFGICQEVIGRAQRLCGRDSRTNFPNAVAQCLAHKGYRLSAEYA